MDYSSTLDPNNYSKGLTPSDGKTSFFDKLVGGTKKFAGGVYSALTSDAFERQQELAKQKYMDNQFNRANEESQKNVSRFFDSQPMFTGMTQESKDLFAKTNQYQSLQAVANIGRYFKSANDGDDTAKGIIKKSVSALGGNFIDDNGRMMIEYKGQKYDLNDQNIKQYQQNVLDSAMRTLKGISATDYNNTGGDPRWNVLAKYTRTFAKMGLNWEQAPALTMKIYGGLSQDQRNFMTLRKTADILRSDGWSQEDKDEAERMGMDIILSQYHMSISPDGRITDPDKKFGQTSYSFEEFSDILHSIDTGMERFDNAVNDLKKANAAAVRADTIKMTNEKQKQEKTAAETLNIKARTAKTEAETADLMDPGRKQRNYAQTLNTQADTRLKNAQTKKIEAETAGKQETPEEQDPLNSLPEESKRTAVLLPSEKQDKLRSVTTNLSGMLKFLNISVEDGNVKGSLKNLETAREYWKKNTDGLDVEFPLEDAYQEMVKDETRKQGTVTAGEMTDVRDKLDKLKKEYLKLTGKSYRSRGIPDIRYGSYVTSKEKEIPDSAKKILRQIEKLEKQKKDASSKYRKLYEKGN